jgi:hypothetical protein
MMDDEDGLVAGYSDYSRVGQVIGGVGALIGGPGGKYSKIQQILRSKVLTPKEKFVESIQLVCYNDSLAFNQRIYDRIGEIYPYPQYLNPKACVLAITQCLNSDYIIKQDIFSDPQFLESLDETSPLDIYRYASFLSKILRGA